MIIVHRAAASSLAQAMPWPWDTRPFPPPHGQSMLALGCRGSGRGRRGVQLLRLCAAVPVERCTLSAVTAGAVGALTRHYTA